MWYVDVSFVVHVRRYRVENVEGLNTGLYVDSDGFLLCPSYMNSVGTCHSGFHGGDGTWGGKFFKTDVPRS